MAYKFEQLEVWQLALEYVDVIYELAAGLPKQEDYNLKSQIVRAATSVALNIAEGSTGQTDPEQARFVGHSIRSLLETVACQHLIHRRKYLEDASLLRKAYPMSERLFARLHALRKAIAPNQKWLREDDGKYGSDEQMPF